jgi:hypothetical protein
MHTIDRTENSRRFRAGEIYSTQFNSSEMNDMEAAMTIMRYLTAESVMMITSTLATVAKSPRPTARDLTRPEARQC